MIVNPGKLLFSAIGSLTQPLFNKGLNVAQLKIAKAQQEEARLAFQQALLNAGSEVNNALTQVQVARGKTELRARQITSLETTVPQHPVTDATRHLHLFGSAHCPAGATLCPTDTGSRPL